MNLAEDISLKRVSNLIVLFTLECTSMSEQGSIRSPTIRDVAKEAGVSAATVSRVINGSSGVSAEKSKRVQQAVERLGYRPNHLARDLSQGTAVDTVGVLVPQLADEFTGTVVTGIERELRKAGLHMLCALSHADPEDEEAALRVFYERRVSGLILVTPSLPDTKLLDYAHRKVPLVLINRRLPELAAHCIHIDNRRAGYLATDYLVSLGHARVVHIAGPLARQDARERLAGFTAALNDHGLERHEWRVLEASDFTAIAGEKAMRHLLQRGEPSAVFAANDLLAAGALVALRKAGLRVPDDVSVVGFDDRSITQLTQPPLSSIHYPMLEVGCRAARHLADLINKQEVTPLPLLTPRLVERSSVAPARK